MNHLKTVFALLFVLFAVQGCRNSTIYPDQNDIDLKDDANGEGTVDINDILGAEWKLVGFQQQTGYALQLDKVPDTQDYTLAFGSGNASGMADCKGYAYQYSHDDKGNISFFNPAPQIALACPPGSYDAAYYSAMESATSYKATNATLYIYYGGGNQARALYFVRKDQQHTSVGVPIVLYQMELVRLAKSDPYKILDVSVTGDQLDLKVQYAGGCKTHDFTLMGPLTIPVNGLIINGQVTETPITAFLYHDANGDACEALVTEDRHFDLTPLKERWKEVTGKTDGTVSLSIDDLHTGVVWTISYRIGNGGSNLPNWLADSIAAISSRPVANPAESIWQYTYKGEIVYYRPAICCDFFSDLYDKDGNILCHPDGGIAGTGDGQCPDFIATKSNAKLIWKDPR